MEFKLFTPYDRASMAETWQVVDFLYEHLDEYGDARQDILKAIQYALKDRPSLGGFVLGGYVEDELVGAVVINKTGMEGYIPENILVYIAVNAEHRGKGYGRKLMRKAIDTADGDIALHVEPDNPARYLYEKMGFENKYLEMRLKSSGEQSGVKKRSAAEVEK